MRNMKLPLLAGLLLCTAIVRAQQPTGSVTRDSRTFRSGVEAVDIDVRVLDERGHPVPNLTRDDFEIFENGQRQTIQLFTPVEIPSSPRALTEARVPSDVQSNRRPFDGRLYVFLLDDLHTHPLRTNLVKRAVRQFIDEHFAENDRAAIAVTSGLAHATQEITGNHAALIDALDRFQGQKLRSSTMERIDQYYRTEDRREGAAPYDTYRTAGTLDPLDMERGHQARLALESMASLAEWLSTVPARRTALVYVSEGIDYDIRDVFANKSASGILFAARDAIAAAARSNVSIYAVDPRGLTSFAEDAIEIAGVPNDIKTDLGTAALNREVQFGYDSLRTLAEETGGFALVNTNDISGGFQRLVRENSSYYVLGYQPTNNRRDGKFRNVDVRVRRPWLRVVARRGYVAQSKDDKRELKAPDGKAADVRALLASPVPVSGLPLDGGATVFRGLNGKASVLVTAELRPEVTTDSNAQSPTRIDVAVMAVAADGKVTRGDHRAVELKPTPELLQAVSKNGFRTMSRLELAPGKYQVRVAALQQGTQRGGSVLLDVLVPDFSATPLALSQPVLASNSDAQAVTARPDPELLKLLPVPPTVVREFATTDTLAVLAEVYDARKARGEVIVHTTIADSDGMTVFGSEQTVQETAFDQTRRAYAHRLAVSLKDMRPGRYVLRIEARSREGNNSVAREVAFAVRPQTPTS